MVARRPYGTPLQSLTSCFGSMTICNSLKIVRWSAGHQHAACHTSERDCRQRLRGLCNSGVAALDRRAVQRHISKAVRIQSSGRLGWRKYGHCMSAILPAPPRTWVKQVQRLGSRLGLRCTCIHAA